MEYLGVRGRQVKFAYIQNVIPDVYLSRNELIFKYKVKQLFFLMEEMEETNGNTQLKNYSF